MHTVRRSRAARFRGARAALWIRRDPVGCLDAVPNRASSGAIGIDPTVLGSASGPLECRGVSTGFSVGGDL